MTGAGDLPGQALRSVAPAGPASQAHTVVLAGEVDMAREPELTALVEDFRAADQVNARVDLSAVTFMDSTGLGTLARLRSIAVERGGTVTLLAPAPPVMRLLEIVGLDTVFPVEAGLVKG